jgi:hypothetical protein
VTPLEALQDLEKLHQQLMAAPPELACLAWFGICEMDRQRAARRNPVQAAMMAAVPNNLMRDIVNDQRRGASAPSSLASTPNAPPTPPPVKGTGWQEHHGFPDRTQQFELVDRMTEAMVGGANDFWKLRGRTVGEQGKGPVSADAPGAPPERPAEPVQSAKQGST